VFRYFVSYCSPLVICDIFGSGANYFERWFLQLVYGSAGQAFYSLAFQWITIIFIFSQSISKVLWKDVAYNFHIEENQRVQNILEKTYNNIFTISLLFSTILIFYRMELIELTAGKAFMAAQPIIVILAVYAIFYNVSQVNSVFFYASAQVKLMRNLRMLNITLRVVLTYILLAPKDYAVPGLSLGAIGLALQGAISCMLMTAIEIFFVSRKVRISLKNFLYEKTRLSFVMVCTAFGCHAFVELFSLSILNRFMLGNGLFFILTGVIVYIYPLLFGFNKQEFLSYAKDLKEMLPGFAESR
jgi:O-antigen/teichoic acid export membrane protein